MRMQVVENHRNGATRRRTMCILVLIGACVTFLNVACILSPFTVVVVEKSASSSLRKSTLLYTATDNPPPVCSHFQELYGSEFSSTAMQDAIHQATAFHQGGGSLQAVQHYLDQQVGPTMKRNELSYKPLDKADQENFDYKHPPPVKEYLRKHYQTHDADRSGYGKLLPVKFFGPTFRKTLHKDKTRARWMDVLEGWDSERFQVAVGPVLPTCPHMTTLSQGTYEHKSFCAVAPNEKKKKQDATDCHIFSVGSNDQWSFEKELLTLHPECHIHTFDCTLENDKPKNKPKDERITFYPFCISGETTTQEDNTVTSSIRSGAKNATEVSKYKSRNYKPYHKLVQATGIRHSPKVLKMDVEGFEYDVLTNMLDATPSSMLPQQIVMEVHFATRMVDLEWMLRTRQTAEMAMFFDLLYNKGGYMAANVKYVEGCPTCMEILLVRMHCAEEAV